MGLIRFLLANAVVFQHLGSFSGHKFIDAGQALYGFFVISGFYMALVLNSKYKNEIKKFYLNRYFRLWPVYFFSICLMILRMYLAGSLPGFLDNLGKLNFGIRVWVLLSNLSMFGLDLLTHFGFHNNAITFAQAGRSNLHNGTSFMLNFPAWSISIEILFYIIAPFIVRSFRRSLVFLLSGIAYCIFLKYEPWGWKNIYRLDLFYPYFIPYFGLGVMSYWISQNYKKITNWRYLGILVLVALILESSLHISSSFYLSLAVIIPGMIKFTEKQFWDKLLGDASYPLYILHIPLLELIKYFHPHAILPKIYLAILITSLLVTIVFEKKLTELRKKSRMFS